MRFDTHDFFAVASQILADGSHAAVGIQHGIACGQIGGGCDGGVQFFRGERVGLEERERGNLEREIEEAFMNVRFTDERVNLRFLGLIVQTKMFDN